MGRHSADPAARAPQAVAPADTAVRTGPSPVPQRIGAVSSDAARARIAALGPVTDPLLLDALREAARSMPPPRREPAAPRVAPADSRTTARPGTPTGEPVPPPRRVAPQVLAGPLWTVDTSPDPDPSPPAALRDLLPVAEPADDDVDAEDDQAIDDRARHDSVLDDGSSVAPTRSAVPDPAAAARPVGLSVRSALLVLGAGVGVAVALSIVAVLPI